MCGWHFAIHVGDGYDDRVARFDFQGGVRPDVSDRARVLEKVRRQVAGYVNTHPDARAELRIVEMSCNGPQREIQPYTTAGERRFEIGGWEGLPGTEVDDFELALAPRRSPPPTLIPALPTETQEVPAGDESDLAVVALKAGHQVGIFQTATQARFAIARWPEEWQEDLYAYLVDDHGELLGRVWPLDADTEDTYWRDRLVADDHAQGLNEFKTPTRDEWDGVRAALVRGGDLSRLDKAVIDLKTWARICAQEVSGGGRANDEQVDVRASCLYSLAHALRRLEAAEGRVLVQSGEPYYYQTADALDSLADVQAAVTRLEEAGKQPRVYTLDPDGSTGARLWPPAETPYKVWSMATANLVAELDSADAAIALVKEDSDDLVAFLEEDDSVTVVYDPNALTRMSAGERRARLVELGRWHKDDIKEEQ
jgi:hypothetical protein